MKREPLFIRFSNGQVESTDILTIATTSINDDRSRKIAEERRSDLPDLSTFRNDFKNALADLIESGISQKIINYVNSYMKPSLVEYVEGSQGSNTGEKRWVSIKDPDTPWMEAIVCYNLCLYIKAFGVQELKRCPVCTKFFSNKGKYAKYCSDVCKSSGKNR